MPNGCGVCNKANVLQITQSLVLPPDSRSDDIILQVVRCASCSFRGLAVYEESRRGSLDSESWSHTAYNVSEGDLKAVAAAIKSCPSPKNTKCRCRSHRELGRRDRNGRWNGLENIEIENSFQIF
jgi:hypothetical protein